MTYFSFKDCYEEAIDYQGYDLGQSSQTSAEACHGACRSDRDCRYFTYLTNTEKCFLKHSKHGRRTVTNPAYISGALHCYEQGKRQPNIENICNR